MLAALQARHTEHAEAQAAEHERISTGHTAALAAKDAAAQQAKSNLTALIAVTLTAGPAFAKAFIAEVRAANVEASHALDGGYTCDAGVLRDNDGDGTEWSRRRSSPTDRIKTEAGLALAARPFSGMLLLLHAA